MTCCAVRRARRAARRASRASTGSSCWATRSSCATAPCTRRSRSPARAARHRRRRSADAEVVLVAGQPRPPPRGAWLDWRERRGPPAAAASRSTPGPARRRHARDRAAWSRPRALRRRLPGPVAADGVYATHGHYLDRHSPCRASSASAPARSARLLRAPPAEAGGARRLRARARADVRARSTARRPRAATAAARTTARRRAAWRTLSQRGRGHWPSAPLAGAFPLAVAGVNRARPRPLRADLSGPALRHAGLRAMGEVVERLSIPTRARDLRPHPSRRPAGPATSPAEWTLARRAARCSTPGRGSTSDVYDSTGPRGNPVLARRRASSSTTARRRGRCALLAGRRAAAGAHGAAWRDSRREAGRRGP